MSVRESNLHKDVFLIQTKKQKKGQHRRKLSSFIHIYVCVIASMLCITGLLPLLQVAMKNEARDTVGSEYFFLFEKNHRIEFADRTTLFYVNERAFQNETWNHTFGGSNIDVGYSVGQTNDGGYILTGYTRSYGANGHNIWLVKTNSSGTEQWNKTFGGANDDEGQSVQQTTDGGYVITGWTKSYGSGLKDLWLIKTDSAGNEQWNKIIGGTNDDAGTFVQQTIDGGYIIAGYTSSFGMGSVDAWLIKTDSFGNQQWNKQYGRYSSDGAWCVQQTLDGGYVITGWTFSYGPGYVGNTWLVKIDSFGNQQWNKTFGGSEADRGYWVQQTDDGGYIITGYTASFGAGLDDALLIKTDISGNEEWSKTFGGTGRDYGYSVQQTIDGGYIVTGYTLSYGAGSEDVWLIKTDYLGNEEWDSTFGGIYSDASYCVQQTTDTGYIVTGYTLSYGAGVHDVWLIKIEGTGYLPLEIDAGGPYNGSVGYTIAFTGTVTGGVSPYTYHWDFGDNTTSNEQSPLHVYNTSGVFVAIFTVLDNVGTQANDTAIVTILEPDDTPPDVTITRPLAKSLYLRDKRIVPFPITLLIGSMNITVDTSDNISGVVSVKFYLNDILKSTDTAPPYNWVWDIRSFGRYTILAEAVDNAGNNATDERIVWRFF